MKRTLKLRLIFWIMGTSVIIFSILSYINYIYSRNEVKKYVRENAGNLARYYGKTFEEKFSRAVVIPKMTAIYLKTGLKGIKEEDLKAYMKDVLENNPAIYGTCIAFEPYGFIPEKRLFAPYCYFKDGKPCYTELKYDYLERDWYKIPKEKEDEVWSEPYFDEGGGNIIMITYSVPFYCENKFKGIATVDISLEELTDQLGKTSIMHSGYIFIVSHRGNFISFPDKSMILKGNIYDCNRELAEKMTSGEDGFLETIDPWKSEKSWIIFYPVKGANFSIGIVYTEEEVLGAIYDLQEESIVTGFAGLIILLIVIIIIANSIVRPITQFVNSVNKIAYKDLTEGISMDTQEYNLTTFLKTPTAEQTYKIKIDTSLYEVKTLETSFNNMIKSLKKYILENQNITAEKERIENELAIARDIQMAVSPRKFPAFPDRKDIDIFGKTIPAKEVGGDFYDFFFIDKENLGFMIGDAAGKGVPAALFMAVSRAFLKATALKGHKPGECLKYVNELLCSENYMDMFITVFYGILNTSSGTLRYSNGGHNPPCLIKKDGIEKMEIASGPALGIFDMADYKTVETVIKKGDGLFLYTDGVDEATDPEENLFSFDRMNKILQDMETFSTEGAIKKMYTEIKKFARGAPQADDITMVALKYNE